MLFVDDDPDQLDLYEQLFSHKPIRVLTSPSGLHALDVLTHHSEPIAVVVSDYHMLGMNGVVLLDTVLARWPNIGRILLTGAPDSEIVLEARQHKVLTKGMDAALISRVIVREAKRHG